MILICAVGMDWEAKAQNFLIAAIVGAMVDFIVGTIVGPKSLEEQAKGFTGFNSKFIDIDLYVRYILNSSCSLHSIYFLFFEIRIGCKVRV